MILIKSFLLLYLSIVATHFNFAQLKDRLYLKDTGVHLNNQTSSGNEVNNIFINLSDIIIKQAKKLLSSTNEPNIIFPVYSIEHSHFNLEKEFTENDNNNLSIAAFTDTDIILLAEYSKEMAQWPYKYELYSYNTDEDKTTLIYSTPQDSRTHHILRIAANGTSVFWVEEVRTENDGTIISLNMMNMRTRKIETLKEYFNRDGSSEVLNFFVTDKYISWYETINKKIIIYDLLNKKYLEVSNPNFKGTSYNGAPDIRGDEISYISSSGNNTVLNRTNLINGEHISVQLPISSNVSSFYADDNYFIWSERSYTKYISVIYVYDYINNKIYAINKDNNNSISGFYLANDTVFIERYIADKGIELVLIDLKTFTVSSFKTSNDISLRQYSQDKNGNVFIHGEGHLDYQYYLLPTE